MIARTKEFQIRHRAHGVGGILYVLVVPKWAPMDRALTLPCLLGIIAEGKILDIVRNCFEAVLLPQRLHCGTVSNAKTRRRIHAQGKLASLFGHRTAAVVEILPRGARCPMMAPRAIFGLHALARRVVVLPARIPLDMHARLSCQTTTV